MLSRQPSDLSTVSTIQLVPEESIRSKGQATLLPAGHAELPATIRDISASGMGVIAATLLEPGTPLDIRIHSHVAHGVVQVCKPEGDGFYIGIVIAE
jgi:PilZ domain